MWTGLEEGEGGRKWCKYNTHMKKIKIKNTTISVYICVGLVMVYMRKSDNLVELVILFYHWWIPDTKLRSLGFATSTFLPNETSHQSCPLPVLKTRSHTGPDAHGFSQAGWSLSFRDLPVPMLSPKTGAIGTHGHTHLLHGSWGSEFCLGDKHFTNWDTPSPQIFSDFHGTAPLGFSPGSQCVFFWSSFLISEVYRLLSLTLLFPI